MLSSLIVHNMSAGPANLSKAPPVINFPVLAGVTGLPPKVWELAAIQLKEPYPVVLNVGTDSEAYTYQGPGATVPGVRQQGGIAGPLGTSRTPSSAASIPLHFQPLVAIRIEYQSDGPTRVRLIDCHSGAYQLPPVTWAKAILWTAVEDAVGAPTAVTYAPEARFAVGTTPTPARALVTDVFEGSPTTLIPPPGAAGVRLSLNETALPGTMAARITGLAGELIALQDHVNQAYWPLQTPVRFTQGRYTHTVTDIAGSPDKTVNYLIDF